MTQRERREEQQEPREDPIERFRRESDEDSSFDFSQFEEVDEDVLEHEEEGGE